MNPRQENMRGSVERFETKDGTPYWRGRIWVLADDGKKRRKWVDPLVPADRFDEGKVREFTAKEQAFHVSRFALAVDKPVEVSRETVSEWYGRYYTWRETRPSGGAESVADSRGIFRKWIEPKLGPLPMTSVTSGHLDAFSAYLDEQVKEETISWKRAGNIWGEVTVAFGVATAGYKTKHKVKDKTLRILTTNPAASATGPDAGDSKSKPFLRPSEVLALLACADVPLDRRQVYAVAIYTACRQGELRGLRVGDVDLEALQISISKQVRDGKEKARTKGGRARTIQVEAHLVPLLKVLMEGQPTDAFLLDVGARNRCASFLREDLITAGCKRAALHVPENDPHRAHLTFHNLRDTCGTHMAVRRDPPQDIQWRLGHSDPKTTEIYIGQARHEAGANFGQPLPPLPENLLFRGQPVAKRSVSSGNHGGGAGNRTRVRK